MLQFTAPALLYALPAAALPFVLHWFFRPRARRVRFPPVGLLRPALASGARARRVNDIRLLVVRSTLIGLLAFLLAGPRCAEPRVGLPLDQAIAAAIVLDDSWSTHYRIDPETTVLDLCRDEAIAAARELTGWPSSSVIGLWFADPAQPPLDPTGDAAAVADRVRAAAATARPHAHPLGDAIRAAATRLAAAPHAARRIIVVTDLAAHAWRDVTSDTLVGIPSLHVEIRAPAIDRRTNVCVERATAPARVHPETLPVPVQVRVRSFAAKATASIVIELDNRTVHRHGPIELAAGSAHETTILLPPLPRGVYGGRVSVEPDDRLTFDQTRFLLFQTGQPPIAWLLVPDAAAARDDLAAVLFENMIAPEELDPTSRPATFRRLAPAALGPALATTGADTPPDLLVLLPGIRLPDATRQSVVRWIEGGATALLVCSSDAGEVDWPGLRPWIARTAPRFERLDAVQSLSWDPAAPALVPPSDGLDSLARAAIRQRLRIADLADGVVVHARFTDGAPALLSVRVGRGQVCMLPTSPDPDWSDLGQRAAGLLTLLHELLRRAQPPAENITEFVAQHASRDPLGDPAFNGTVVVGRDADRAAKGERVRLSGGRPATPWPADQPGLYTISDNGTTVARYAVNWPPEESDPTPITLERVRGLIGRTGVTVDVGQNTPANGSDIGAAANLGHFVGADAIAALLATFLVIEIILAARGNRVRNL